MPLHFGTSIALPGDIFTNLARADRQGRIARMISQYSPAYPVSQVQPDHDFVVSVELEASIIPVRMDGKPDGVNRCRGHVVEVGSRGLALVGERLPTVPGAELMVGVKTPAGRMEYVGIQLPLSG